MLHVSLLPELPTIAVSCASAERIAHLAVLCCAPGFRPGLCRLWVVSGPHAVLRPCPLWPRKRTSFGVVGMSASCREATYAAQQNRAVIRSRRLRAAGKSSLACSLDCGQ